MQRCRVSSKSITLNGFNIQSPSTKDPSKELMDQRFDGRFITDSPQVTFNRAGKCCGILKEISLDMPVKTLMFYSMTFMIFCFIKTGKHLEKLEPNLTVTAVIHANRSLVLINTSVV